MLKKHYCIFFFFFSSIGFSALSSIEMNKILEILIEQKNFSLLAREVNLRQLSLYEQCLEDTKEELYIEYLAKDGNIKSTDISCQAVVKTVFDNRLEDFYQEMRISLALLKTARRDSAHIMSLSSDLNYKINKNIAHPNSTTFKSLPFNLPKLAPLDADEVEMAMNLYRSHSYDMCLNYIYKYLPQELEMRKTYLSSDFIKGLDLEGFCDNRGRFNFQEDRNSIERQTLVDIERRYHTWLEHKRDEFRSEHRENYYDIINYAPYFLLLDSRSPKSDNLLESIKKINGVAMKEMSDFNDKIQSDKINERIKLYRLGKLDDEDKYELIDDLFFSYNPLLFEVYLEVSNMSKDDINFFSSFAEDKVKDNEFDSLLSDAGVVLGSALGCFIPVGRIFKGLNKLVNISRAGCFMTVGLGVSTFFLYDSFRRYQGEMVKFLSSPEGQFALSEFEDVKRSRLDLILNMILF